MKGAADGSMGAADGLMKRAVDGGSMGAAGSSMKRAVDAG
jgi:hypothetical protein